MTKFRTRLLFALVTLIFIVLISLGLLLGHLFKTHYINSFDERLEKESNLVATYIEENGGLDSVNSSKVVNYSKILKARITIVDLKGTVLYDSGDVDGINNNKHTDMISYIVENDRNEVGLKVVDTFDFHYYWKSIKTHGEKQGYILLSAKMEEIQKAYQQIWWVLTISLGLALFIIILLSMNIMNRYTKPIESATNVAIELAKGNYRARTYESHMDETSMLSSSINILARNLQDMKKAHEMQNDRLATLIENMGSGLILIDSRGYINLINRTYKEIFNVTPDEYVDKLYFEVIEHKEISKVIEEIFMTEQKVRKQLVLPLRIERKHFEIYGVPIIGKNDVWKGILLVFHDITELKKLEQMRKDFVANVSHELKTPITSIKGFSETLLDGAMDSKETLEAFLNIILKESDRLQSLIQDLLELSKIEQHGFILTVQPVNLISILEEVVAIMDGKAVEKEISLHFDNHPTEVWLEGDVYRLKQVFINLISNALSYTPNNGTVSLSIDETEKNVIVHVKDTGIGIHKEEIPRIFERFYRIDKARSRNSGGTGLGLAIVKHLLEAHKGQIKVESEVGKSTTFSVTLSKEFPT